MTLPLAVGEAVATVCGEKTTDGVHLASALIDVFAGAPAFAIAKVRPCCPLCATRVIASLRILCTSLADHTVAHDGYRRALVEHSAV
jgi:hypothetical protein